MRLNETFEFVLVNSVSLVNITEFDWRFKQYFTEFSPAVSFKNLGKQCDLVCPNPLFNQTNHAHFASFVRTAPVKQIQGFMKFLGRKVLNRIHDQKLKKRNMWVSTSGDGVAWLHVRLCPKPKYYRHTPYTNKSVCHWVQ